MKANPAFGVAAAASHGDEDAELLAAMSVLARLHPLFETELSEALAEYPRGALATQG